VTDAERKQVVLDTVADTALRFAVYDRKDDEELSKDELEELVESGVVTLDEIVEAFRQGLIEAGLGDG
jgi:hypothetical protein